MKLTKLKTDSLVRTLMNDERLGYQEVLTVVQILRENQMDEIEEAKYLKTLNKEVEQK